MNGDRLDTNGGSYTANITLSDGGTRQDSNWLRGKLAEMRQFDASGNVLIRNVYWYTSTLTAGSGDLSTSSDDRTVELSYVYSTTAHIVNTPQWEKLWARLSPGSAGQEQSYTAYAYDGQAIGVVPIKGDLTLVRSCRHGDKL
jgi:hypothetical protein